MACLMKSVETADIIVIGGGLIGSALAFRLAQAGRRVIVLDRGEPGQQASHAAAGMLTAQSHLNVADDFSRLCLASRRLYPQYLQEIRETSGTHVDYFDRGTLVVARRKEEWQELDRSFAEQRRLQLPVEKLSSEKVLRMGAGLSLDIEGGLYVPGDHWLDSAALTEATLEACRRAGVRFIADTEIRAAALEGDRVVHITSTTRRFSADQFVLAAGCWSGQMAQLFKMNLPVRPIRGQILELQTNRELPYTVWSGPWYWVPRGEGRLLVGATIEDAGFNAHVTADGLLSILKGTMRFAPWLREARFCRAWAGLRPDTRDHAPILGRGELSNLVMATGHYRSGILLAPITARLLSDLILKNAGSPLLTPFSPLRFGSGPSAATRREK